VGAICQSIRRLAPYEAACCFATTGPHGRYSRDEAQEIVLNGYKVATAAVEEGMTIALEVQHSSQSRSEAGATVSFQEMEWPICRVCSAAMTKVGSEGGSSSRSSRTTVALSAIFQTRSGNETQSS
jgi:hypothetical protein